MSNVEKLRTLLRENPHVKRLSRDYKGILKEILKEPERINPDPPGKVFVIPSFTKFTSLATVEQRRAISSIDRLDMKVESSLLAGLLPEESLEDLWGLTQLPQEHYEGSLYGAIRYALSVFDPFDEVKLLNVLGKALVIWELIPLEKFLEMTAFLEASLIDDPSHPATLKEDSLATTYGLEDVTTREIKEALR